jgi:hypothetical protein
MIYFNINIRNPYWWKRFENVKCWSGLTPINYKCWEVQITKCDNLFRFVFDITTHQDHAGIKLELALLGYEIDFTFYDNRHWDLENNCWKTYD